MKPNSLNKISFKQKKKKKRFALKSFELFASIGGYNKGTIIPLECDKKTGIPKDKYWRRRLLDAQKDGCIVRVVVEKTKKKEEGNK